MLIKILKSSSFFTFILHPLVALHVYNWKWVQYTSERSWVLVQAAESIEFLSFLPFAVRSCLQLFCFPSFVLRHLYSVLTESTKISRKVKSVFISLKINSCLK